MDFKLLLPPALRATADIVPLAISTDAPHCSGIWNRSRPYELPVSLEHSVERFPASSPYVPKSPRCNLFL